MITCVKSCPRSLPKFRPQVSSGALAVTCLSQMDRSLPSLLVPLAIATFWYTCCVCYGDVHACMHPGPLRRKSQIEDSKARPWKDSRLPQTFTTAGERLHVIGPSAARPFSYRANVAVVTRDGYIEGPTALLEPSPGALR